MVITNAKFECPKCGVVDRVIIVPMMPVYGVHHQCRHCDHEWALPEPPLTEEELEEQQPGYIPQS